MKKPKNLFIKIEHSNKKIFEIENEKQFIDELIRIGIKNMVNETDLLKPFADVPDKKYIDKKFSEELKKSYGLNPNAKDFINDIQNLRDRLKAANQDPHLQFCILLGCFLKWHNDKLIEITSYFENTERKAKVTFKSDLFFDPTTYDGNMAKQRIGDLVNKIADMIKAADNLLEANKRPSLDQHVDVKRIQLLVKVPVQSGSMFNVDTKKPAPTTKPQPPAKRNTPDMS